MKPEQFKQYRKLLGLSQSEMAKALGLKSPRSVRHYEAGTRRISGPLVLLIASLLKEQPKKG